MGEDIGKETALEIAKDSADEDCVGELGEILDVTEEESLCIVELRTHTFDDSYDHLPC